MLMTIASSGRAVDLHNLHNWMVVKSPSSRYLILYFDLLQVLFKKEEAEKRSSFISSYTAMYKKKNK